MNEEIFWQLVAQSKAGDNRDFETQCTTLTRLLAAYTEKEILEFEQILRAKIEEASSFPIMAATFVVCSFISDDTYEDFRAWLVGQGKENFYKALKDPNEIGNFLDKKQAEDLGGEYMLFVAMNAYLEKTGTDDEEAFYEMIEHPEEREFEQKWPETKEQYRKLFPALYDKFWDEKKIRQKLEEAEEEEGE